MGPVIRSGGIIPFSTESRIANGHGLPQNLMFSGDELQKLIVRDFRSSSSGRAAVQPLAGHPGDEGFQREMEKNVKRFIAGSEAAWSTYPRIILDASRCQWTSYYLALRKPLESKPAP